MFYAKNMQLSHLIVIGQYVKKRKTDESGRLIMTGSVPLDKSDYIRGDWLELFWTKTNRQAFIFINIKRLLQIASFFLFHMYYIFV